jgi:hypothetical protein
LFLQSDEVGVKYAKDEEVEGAASKDSNSNPSITSLVVLVVGLRGGEGRCNSIGGKREDIVAAAVEDADRVEVLRRAVFLPSGG